MTSKHEFWSQWSLPGLIAFAAAGALLGSWRFSAVGAFSGACLGIVANLVVAYLETNKSPLAFFLGFTAIGPAVGLAMPLNPQEDITRWGAVLGCSLAFVIVGLVAAAVVWLIHRIVHRLSKKSSLQN